MLWFAPNIAVTPVIFAWVGLVITGERAIQLEVFPVKPKFTSVPVNPLLMSVAEETPLFEPLAIPWSKG